MAIEFLRIDDRLLHGQVVTTWIKNMKLSKQLLLVRMYTKTSLDKQF